MADPVHLIINATSNMKRVQNKNKRIEKSKTHIIITLVTWAQTSIGQPVYVWYWGEMFVWETEEKNLKIVKVDWSILWKRYLRRGADLAYISVLRQPALKVKSSNRLRKVIRSVVAEQQTGKIGQVDQETIIFC